ncbi:MAG: LamG-like jellyroll fold domain-containing protein, partial [Candidatus Dormibacteraceae bacterium]
MALPAGAVSWWQAEGNAIDSLRGNDGQPSGGLAYSSGEVGRAFRFGGNSGNCVRIPYAASLGSPTYTVEAWVNPVVPIADAANQKVVFAQNTGRVALLLRPGKTGVQVVFGYYSGAGVWQLLPSPVEIPLAQFSHVAATWDGTTQRLYVNGALTAQRVPAAPPLDSGCDFFIGGIYSTAGGSACQYSGQFFQGLVDELRYYRRPLITTEIQTVYNAGQNGAALPPPSPALVAGPNTRPATFALDLQKRDPASGEPYLTRQVFRGSQMAIIVMDVWNSHPDPEMASRGSALIPRMNEALVAARALGITVIFCPNEVSPPAGANTTAFSGLPNQPLIDNGFNPPLPSFTSSSPGDMVPVRYDASYAPRFPTYTSQHPDLIVEPGDLASTSRQQIYNYCAAHGISYLLYMGVAANMCV